MKGKYRSPADTTASVYGSLISRMISLPLRWIQLHKSKDKIDIERLKALGVFQPLWKGGLKPMVEGFLEFINGSKGKLEKKTIIKFIHTFLVATFTEKTFNFTLPIDSILEQTVLAFMIHPCNGWKPASAMISTALNNIKNISRAVLIHCAFLSGFDESYISPQEDNANEGHGAGSDSDSDEDSDFAEDLDSDEGLNSDEDLDEDENENGNCDADEDLNFGFMNLGKSTTTSTSEGEHVLE
jgi:hypothetical protein